MISGSVISHKSVDGNLKYFRSVLPHEPLPLEPNGYILLQGALSPRLQLMNTNGDISTDDIKSAPGNVFPINLIKEMMEYRFCIDPLYNEQVGQDHPSSSSYVQRKLPHLALSVELLESNTGCTKARLRYKSPEEARRMAAYWKRYPPTPHQLFNDLLSKFTSKQNNNEGDETMVEAAVVNQLIWKFGNKSTLTTQITTKTLNLQRDQCWDRSSPPKFRRIVLSTEELENFDEMKQVELLESLRIQRSQTRFVFMTNILPSSESNLLDIDGDELDDSLDQSLDSSLEEDYDCIGIFQDALRKTLSSLDTTEHGIEIFISRNSYNRRRQIKCSCSICGKPFSFTLVHHVHIGMRNPADAQRLVDEFQGQYIPIEMKGLSSETLHDRSFDHQGHECCIQTTTTGKLFFDFVDFTKKCTTTPLPSCGNASIEESHQSTLSRLTLPDCTSSTSSVEVPGLVLIPDFLSSDEEEVLLAAITGPDAPWAPLQRNFSNTGSVKRRVQHYGYVFDYETADVLRDRESDEKASCPPIPAIPRHLYAGCDPETLLKFIQDATIEGNGWALLAGITERVRNLTFSSSTCDKSGMPLSFPHLNQLTVNEYKPGEGIGSHIDTPQAFSDGIISISLGGDCVMEFRLPSSEHMQDNHLFTSDVSSKKTNYISRKLVHLPPRSLLLMSGPARLSWEHMIVSRMTDLVEGKIIPRRTRVSLTLRTALNLPSFNVDPSPLDVFESSIYPPRWGTAANSTTSLASTLVTPATEKRHVHAVYDAIATQWHHTRGKRGVLWPMATQFLRTLPKGSIVADIGCGDGKYFPAIWDSGSYVLGLDISLPLLQAARRSAVSRLERVDVDQNLECPREPKQELNGLSSYPPVIVADCIHIPIKDHSVDAAMCIAVMHHLSTVERRIRCLQELSRIVKVGGLINVQAWAKEQEETSRRKFSGTDVFVPFSAQPKYLDKVNHKQGKSNLSSLSSNGSGKEIVHDGVGRMYSDAYDGAEYDESKGLVVFHRYCHMYRQGELEELVEKVPTLEILESGIESGNHFVVLRVRCI